MKHITIAIEYAGLSLSVTKHEGSEYVPLEPITDLFGLRWAKQREKVANDPFYRSYLGTCTLPRWCADGQKREQTCIRLDRVAAYLMTLSPAMIRAQGNTEGADFLEARLNEWADALHDYETLGAAFNDRHLASQITLRAANAAVKLIRAKALTAVAADRGLIDGLLQNIALENGIPYQPELIPTTTPEQPTSKA